MPGLLGLPEEMLQNILLDLPSCCDILHCSESCRTLYTLVNTSAPLIYRIELGKGGLVEGAGSSSLPQSSGERIERLRTMLSRRRRFEPKLLHEWEVVTAEQASDFHDGVYVRLIWEESGDDTIACLHIQDVSGDPISPEVITALDPDSLPPNAPLPIQVCVVPSEDLVVLLTLDSDPDGPWAGLHFRSLSSGGASDHARAHEPNLKFLNEGSEECRVIVDSDIVAVFCVDYQLQIYRWTTGEHILEWYCDVEPASERFDCFSLISSTCFVLGCDESWLEVHRLPTAKSTDTLPLERTITPRLRLLLPHALPHSDDYHMATSRSRSPIGDYEAASRITMLLRSAQGAMFAMAIRSDIFERLLAMHLPKECQVDGSPSITINWDAWGPGNSKQLDYPIGQWSYDSAAVSGSRCIVEKDEIYAGVRTNGFYCFDFGDVNDPDFMRAAQAREASYGPLACGVFAEIQNESDSQNSFPYYVVETRQDAFPYSLVLFDGNRMICMSYIGDDTAKSVLYEL
ncbi:hypothetical protein PENSPDRAFT_747839 [Peniophora sp. CONT]|nr:hypothetical protein PENSPDRAFT_747839 [Peniophora sp. CONT]